MNELIKKLVDKTDDFEYDMRRFLKNCEEMEFNISRNNLSADEAYHYHMVSEIAAHLEKAFYLIEQMNKEVYAEGILQKNENGRYEINGYSELTSGSPLEIWVEDEDYLENGYYVPTTIEHNGEDYYAVALGLNTPIEGLKVRLK